MTEITVDVEVDLNPSEPESEPDSSPIVLPESPVPLFLEELKTWMGTPFYWNQRNKGMNGGCDCLGLIIGALRNISIQKTEWDYQGYGNHNPNIQPAFYEAAQPYFDQVFDSSVQSLNIFESTKIDGDVVLFEITGDIQHIGVIWGERFIHAHQIHGVIYGDLYKNWIKRIRYGYRLKSSQ